MDSKIQEIINFFELEEGYNKQEYIDDVLGQIKELKGLWVDEISIEWDGRTLMTLDDFALQFYDKIINGVCNVIKTFKTND